MAGLLDRGLQRRPELARNLHGCVELRFEEDVSPIRVVFGPDVVTVEDVRAPARTRRPAEPGILPAPDVVISGRLPAVVQLASAPQLIGVPSPISARGRQAWRSLTSGAVRIEGRTLLARRLMQLLEL